MIYVVKLYTVKMVGVSGFNISTNAVSFNIEDSTFFYFIIFIKLGWVINNLLSLSILFLKNKLHLHSVQLYDHHYLKWLLGTYQSAVWYVLSKIPQVFIWKGLWWTPESGLHLRKLPPPHQWVFQWLKFIINWCKVRWIWYVE